MGRAATSKTSRGPVERISYRAEEVAAALGISRTRVYDLLRAGKLRGVKADGTLLITARDLHDYIDSLPDYLDELRKAG